MVKDGHCLSGDEDMNYYLGFRHGWIAFGRRMVCWHDPVYYPHFGRGVKIGRWKVRVQ